MLQDTNMTNDATNNYASEKNQTKLWQNGKLEQTNSRDAQRIERVLTNIFNSANQIMLSVVKL